MNDEVRDRLQELIAKNGTGLADDPRRVEAMLRDVAPGDTQEIFVLVSALGAHVVPEARQWHSSLPPEALVRRLTDRLRRELGLAEEPARWSVESWLLALGIPLPRQPPPTGEGAPPAGKKAPSAGKAARGHPAPPAQRTAAHPPGPGRGSPAPPPAPGGPSPAAAWSPSPPWAGPAPRPASPQRGPPAPIPPSSAWPGPRLPRGYPATGGRVSKLIVVTAALAFLPSVTKLPDYVNNGTGPRTLLQATSHDPASPLYPYDFWTPVILAVLVLTFTVISFGVFRRSLMVIASVPALGLVAYTCYIPTRGVAPGLGPYGSGYGVSLAAAVIALCAGVAASVRSH
jgi:hypothetical protein